MVSEQNANDKTLRERALEAHFALEAAIKADFEAQDKQLREAAVEALKRKVLDVLGVAISASSLPTHTQIWDDSDEPVRMPVCEVEGVILGLGWKNALRAWGFCKTCQLAFVPVWHIGSLADLGNVIANDRTNQCGQCANCAPKATWPPRRTDSEQVLDALNFLIDKKIAAALIAHDDAAE